MKKPLSVALAFAALSAVSAEYYVNCQMDDYTGHDGTTPEKAYETIQEAVGRPNGSIIHVAPGRYDKGLGRASGHWWLQSRVSITDKNLTFIADEGAAKTFIVGEHDSDTGNYGPKAVRCVDVLDNSTDNKVVFKGFTLCDGATAASNSSHGGAGGAALCSNGSSGVPTAYFVDCVVSNCIGAVNLVFGGTWIRSHITHNDFTYNATANSDTGFSGARFLNSVFSHNRHVNADGTSRSANVSFVSGCKVVNCTLAANGCGFWGNSPIYKYNSLISACGFDGATDGEKNNAYDVVDNFLMIAPRLGDWRVRAGSLADGTAAAQYLAADVIALPDELESERCKDFYGRAYDTTTTFMMGAVQEKATQVAGAVRFGSTNATFGDPAFQPKVQDYVIPTAYPTNYLVKPVIAAGNRVYCYEFSACGLSEQTIRYPMMDDTLWVMPPPSTSTKLTISLNAATGVIYADAETTEAEGTQDGSADHPFRTLQQAAKAAADKNVIVAKKGTYKDGCGERVFPDATYKVRYYPGSKQVRLVSESGAAETFIEGAADPATGGNGTGATLLVARDNSNNAAVQGFTLRNGYSGTGYIAQSGKGPVWCYGKDLHFLDCVFTGNTGANAAVGGGDFRRCVFTGNTGANCVLISSSAFACAFYGNTIASGSVIGNVETGSSAWDNDLFDCSISGDGVHNTLDGRNPYDRYFNVAIAKGVAVSGTKGAYAGNMFGGFSAAAWTSGVTVGDPMFRSATDVHVFSLSPTTAVGASDAAAWWYYAETDLSGRPWAFDGKGGVVAGAYQDTFGGGVYVADDAGLSVSGCEVGFNEITEETTLAAGLAAGSARPIRGVVVNGEVHPFDESSAGLPSIALNVGPGLDYAVSVLYAEDRTWYVDAVNGSDTLKFGYNPGYAFKTLKKAMENRAAGDTVVALPGTYDEGEMFAPGTTLIPRRVVIPNDVTLVSRDGAATTVIKGRKSDVPPEPNKESANFIEGLGPNAIAGVFVNDAAVIRGFTITHGYTRGVMTDGAGNHGSYETNGGGVAGYGRVYDCVLTDNAAFRGGAGKNTKFYNCVFDGNKAIYGGGATSDAQHYGCLAKNNVCTKNSGWKSFFYWDVVENCTILDAMGGPGGYDRVLKNTLVWGDVGSCDWQSKDPGMTSANYVNCVFADRETGNIRSPAYHDKMTAGKGCKIVSPDNLKIDADGRPVVGANEAVDAGDPEIASYLTETDALGGQRIYNDALDVGALEGDWRGRYARDVSGRLVGTAASPAVTEQDGKVRLTDATAFSARQAERVTEAKDYVLNTTVSGAGTLTITIDGETFATLTEGSAQTKLTLDVNGMIGFAFAGEGYADIGRMRGTDGTLLLVR